MFTARRQHASCTRANFYSVRRRGEQHIRRRGGPDHLTRYLGDGKSVLMHVARAGHSFTDAALFADVYHCNASRLCPEKYNSCASCSNCRTSARCASAFCSSCSSEPIRKSLAFALDVPLKELTTHLGFAHQTFYRQLAAIERERVIERSEHVIRLARSV